MPARRILYKFDKKCFLKPKKDVKIKIALILLAVLCAVFSVMFFAVGHFFFQYGLARGGANGSNDRIPKNLGSVTERQNRTLEDEAVAAWVACTGQDEVRINTFDGIGLWAKYYKPLADSHDWLIAVHGYKKDSQNVRNVAMRFSQQAYNVLTPDLRAHGKSGGDHIGMGWLDRLDMLNWIDYILHRDPQAKIVLYGRSMGAAAVMMTAGEKLPPNVCAIIEDCGYTSVYDMFVSQLDYQFHLPPFPIINAVGVTTSWRAGYDIKEASSSNQLRKATVPILFIHGREDHYVPCEMVYQLYDIPNVYKEILIVPGAEHGNASTIDPEQYFSTVFNFLSKI